MTKFKLEADDVRKILDGSRRGINIMRIPDPMGIDEGAAHDHIVTALAGLDPTLARDMAADLDDILSNRTDPALCGFPVDPATGQPIPYTMPLDELTAQVMAHSGVDPLAACCVAVHASFVLRTDDDGYQARVDRLAPGATSHTWGRLGPGVRWMIEGAVHDAREFPHTVMAAIQDRMLSDVLSHPVTDPLPLRITEVRRTPWYTHIDTDHAPHQATAGQLLSISLNAHDHGERP